VPMFGTPVVSSRPEPVRAARIPEAVKLAITTMVEEGEDFISAAKRHGVTAQMMRRWLGRAEAISFLRKERSRFRQSACAANEAYLVAIRAGDNSAAAVHAIRTLEQLADNEVAVIRQEARPIDITPRPSQIIDAGER
jgi:transposase-like protein